MTLAPAERADILVDFSGVPAGTQIIMTNWAPAPFPLGALPDPDTTGQIMRFTVQNVAPTPPASLPFNLTTIPALTPDSPSRVMTLNEAMNFTTGLPMGVFLNGQPMNGGITETPVMGSTEEWEIVNLTADTHPIHLHLAQFQILNREAINALAYGFNWDVANGLDPSMGLQGPLDHPTVNIPVAPYRLPNAVPPFINEQGWKDTIQVPPGFVTRIRVRWAPQDAVGTSPGVNAFSFDPTFGPGYVWHCHILEHEDNEMMRPLAISDMPPTLTPNTLG
jgi:FtsP/CotA-like multicopper oxidase with cupredoxin domain